MADKKLTKDQEADEIVKRLKHGTQKHNLSDRLLAIIAEEIRKEIDQAVLDELLRDTRKLTFR